MIRLLLNKSFFGLTLLVVILSTECHSQNKPRIRRIPIKNYFPVFKNDSSEIVKGSMPISNKVLYDYKLTKIEFDTINHNDSIYIIKIGNYKTSKKEKFKIAFKKNIIYLKYKEKEQVLYFKELYDVKFFGYRKDSEEMNFYFSIQKDKLHKRYFYFRFFLNEKYDNDKKVYITFFDTLPYDFKIRSFCKSENNWNNILEKPRSPKSK